MPDLQLVGKPGKADDLQRKTDVLMKMYEEAGYADRLMSVADRRIQLAQEQLMGKSHGARYESAGDVVGRFRQIGRLMRQGGGFSVGFLDLNGWDTHVSQGADAGPLSTKLRQLANGLAAFRQEMNDVWSVCQVLVISEFGRTYRENGNRGTDHGRGTTAMLLSGQPYTQSVLGEQLIHAQHSLNENRDWPVLNNYREVVSRVVLGRMGLDPKASREVMRLG